MLTHIQTSDMLGLCIPVRLMVLKHRVLTASVRQDGFGAEYEAACINLQFDIIVVCSAYGAMMTP
jgi:hypothetical protein